MKIITLAILFTAFPSLFAVAQNLQTAEGKLHDWPTTSKTVAVETIARYGEPDISASEMLIWQNRAPWTMIQIDKYETRHSFPIEHTDLMMQCVSFQVPVDKISDLVSFNGSLSFDRTRGTMCSRCDKETNNMLVLNLAYDIITNRKTVEQARQAFSTIVRQNMNGATPEYMHRLIFKPMQNTADAGENITGLTKSDVVSYRKRFTGR